ncbi:MAG: class I SAM-dependent methyltransferase [Elusimicrobiota bacterium]
MPSGADIGRCYPPVYFEGFFKQYWKDVYKGRALAERLTAWRAEGDFLDVGCALGTMAAGVRDHSKWRARGIEFSSAAADLGSRLNHLEIKPVPITAAPFPDGSFDFVHINNVLEHESDPRAALIAAARLLKPGGRLELTVPNGPVDLLPNRTLAVKWGHPVPTRHGGHLYFFARRTLVELLPACGLKVISIKSFHLKLGAKARGWLPRSYKQFAKELRPVDLNAPPPAFSLEQGRAQIPAPRNWAMYRLSDRWRRLWRFPHSDFGYDFEVLAEKI